MIVLQIFVSCGAEVSPQRDVAVRVLRALERTFTYGLEIAVSIQNWDYRDQPPEVVLPGDFSARSLRMVETAAVVVGILGATVPTVTSEEILRATEQLAAGTSDAVLLFLRRGARGPEHDRLLRRVKYRTKRQVVYQQFRTNLDLQEQLFVALTPFVVRRAILDRQTPIAQATGSIA